MMYLGVDLHRKRSHVVALGPAGEVLLSRRIGSRPDEFLRIFGEFGDQPLEVAFEAARTAGQTADGGPRRPANLRCSQSDCD